MPTYLRWIAAMTAGISMYFTYTIASFGIARANDVSELAGAVGAMVAFGAWIVTLVATLAVNEWLSRRYPPVPSGDRVADRTGDSAVGR